MLPSRKIYMGITGAAFAALGIICILKPMSTLVSLAWILGLITLISGIATLLNWFNLKGYFPQSGSILLSSILQILLGFFFLRHDLAFATILPIIFAVFLIIEGINLAIRSFDYKKIGFRLWWLNLTLGIIAAVLGFISIGTPSFGGAALSTVLGIGLIIVGVVYFIALCSINRFEKRLNDNPWVDDQSF